MSNTAYLILEDGTIFEGKSFGAKGDVTGELVFTTGMTGYLETLTDRSYHGQIVLQTFPLIGNYGVISADFENSEIGAKAYIVKHPCKNPSNFRSEGDLGSFLAERDIIGLCGIDTRMLTKIIREKGVMNGKITSYPPTQADLDEAKAYSVQGAVAFVTSKTIVSPTGATATNRQSRRIALMDYGKKHGIEEALKARGCEIWIFPYDTQEDRVMEIEPSGIMLSNGPGDPADFANAKAVETIAKLRKTGIPIFGICLGHQFLALASGYKTKKLKFGHRGGNQPVRDMQTGRVYITSQNHGYAVIADDCAFVNINDGTCEGMDYGDSFSVQFHPEARSGPLDTAFLFDRFLVRVDSYNSRHFERSEKTQQQQEDKL